MHSFTSCLMHCVWATKERRPSIKPELQQRLWPYLGGIARESKMKALMIGGVEDHVHVLLSIHSTLSVAKSIQLLKGNSSKWIHDTFKEHWDFERSEEHTSELQSRLHLVCRLLLEKKKNKQNRETSIHQYTNHNESS